MSNTAYHLKREDMQVVFRYALEEQMRRAIMHDAEPLNKAQILKLLWPTHKDWVEEVMQRRAVEIKAEVEASGEGDAEMEYYRGVANMLRERDAAKRGMMVKAGGAGEESKQQAKKKEEGAGAVTASIDVYGLAEEMVGKHPWN
jgi:hypothetical protein